MSTCPICHGTGEIANVRDRVTGPTSIVVACASFAQKRREHFVVLYLDTRGGIIRRRVVSIGTVNAALVHPREVFAPALRLNAHSVAVVHNHPSGDPTPSDDDVSITRALAKAGQLLGITLVVHVILARGGRFYSFLESGML